jgi:4-hydroxy-tetrahydrodipicolinate synthase
MARFEPGLVHVPVTPFTRDHAVDYDGYGRVLDFHLRYGAESLALPMHAGEAVSLADAEQRALVEFAIKHVAGRVPVVAHVSDAGSAIAAERARHAQAAGAAAIIVTTPYYWTPPPAMLLQHFAHIGAAVTLPFFVHNAPGDNAGSKISADLVLKLVQRCENFAGVVDSGLDWQFLIEVISEAQKLRPDFQLVAGNEYVVSCGAVGGRGMFSALAAVAPRLVGELHELCAGEQFVEAREAQESLAALRQLIGGVAELKAAIKFMARDSGAPRPPNLALDESAYAAFKSEVLAFPPLGDEPRGW